MRPKVSVSMAGSTLKRIDSLAREMGWKRSTCVERLILDSLEEREDVAKLLRNPRIGEVLSALFAGPGGQDAVRHMLRHAGREERKMLVVMLREMTRGGKAAGRGK